ncbi:MAG TPA: hypothetical protein PKD85_14350 [Saprospiraceae bacterium]|nr:hypothetical protein [Saprospiraceae bacterium]
MESTFILRKDQLDQKLLEGIKNIYKDSKLIQIIVRESEDFDLYSSESNIQYIERLEKAALEISKGEKVEFDEESFDELISDLIK